ncbi:MAG: hypothetical protein OXD01_06130 [Gammaproteobacteria bacterium]|nr:hypothetical protein [Gammaproteobacteria bacterium]
MLLLLLSGISHAQSNYASFELQRENNWDPLVLEDMNGDGGKDIVVSYFDPEIGRELHIYHQQVGGRYNANPQRVEIKTEIIAVGFADVRREPGTELVLFANNGVFSLSTAIEGYAGNLKLLAEWDLIASIPNQDQVHFTNLPVDINDDGHIDLVLPGDENYGIFLGHGDERFTQAMTFSTLNEDITPIQRSRSNAEVDANLGINAEQGVLVEINLKAPTPFDGFVEVWDQQADLNQALLESEQWLPTVNLINLNQDELLDIVYLNAGDNGLGRINIHLQDQQTLFSSVPDWSGDIDSRGDIKLTDMNGDGLADLLRLSGDGNQWEARFYINRGGSFTFQTPDQVMRLSGYEMAVNVVMVEPEETVLSVSYYTVPVVDVIRNASIERTQLIYSRDPDLVFVRRPSSRLQERFSADNVRGLSEQIALHYDINGDGRNDALYVTTNGTLAAKAIDSNLQIASAPFWEYVSPRTVFEFEVLPLNNDGRPDLLLRHGTTTSLLVAQP